MTESEFIKRKIKPELDKRDKLFYFIKEARSIRGIPDICGSYKGRFFALEVKKNESEGRKNTGRIVLQKHRGLQINRAHGLFYIVYPENLEEVLEDLDRRCTQTLFS